MKYIGSMMRIQKILLLIHFMAWLIILLVFNGMVYGENVPNPIYSAAIVTLICMLVFYAHYYLFSHFFNRKAIVHYITGLIVVFAVSPFLFLWVLNSGFEQSTFHYPNIPFFALTLIIVLFSSLAKATENRLISYLKKEELEKESLSAELLYLKSQINPHFLFNTLNNIHTLAYKKSPSTPEAVMRLSSLMRYMIYESNSNTVPLNREIEYLRDFINLQQLRYKNKSVVDFEINGKTEGYSVPPLLFIHLLENAYKHSQSKLDKGDIIVKLMTDHHSLTFTVENPNENQKEAKNPDIEGIGLANLQKRLDLLFPNTHIFKVDDSPNKFTAYLKIDGLNHEG